MKFLRSFTRCRSRYEGRQCCLPRWHLGLVHYDAVKPYHWQWVTEAQDRERA